jgi:hypothetical protein
MLPLEILNLLRQATLVADNAKSPRTPVSMSAPISELPALSSCDKPRKSKSSRRRQQNNRRRAVASPSCCRWESIADTSKSHKPLYIKPSFPITAFCSESSAQMSPKMPIRRKCPSDFDPQTVISDCDLLISPKQRIRRRCSSDYVPRMPQRSGLNKLSIKLDNLAIAIDDFSE